MKSPPITIRLDADIKASVDALAAKDGRSLSSYINRALREHLIRVGKPQQQT